MNALTFGWPERSDFAPVADVFAMHARHGIQPNPLYAAGMGRVGCMPCIMCRKDELRHIADQFPEEIERVAQMEAIVSAASKRGVSTFFSADKTPGDHTSDFELPMPRIHEVVLWSRTSRGGRQLQFDLTAKSASAAELLTSCDQWGACE